MTPPPRLEALFSLKGVVAAALLYGAINAALTLAAGPALALDDVKLNVFTQSLEGGYLPDNPPLFEWTLFIAQLAFGPTLASFIFVKSAFLVATAAFTYLAAKAASGDAQTGAVAALALPLIPQFGWSFHQTLTHSAALFAAAAFFWFALLRLERRAGVLDFAMLGAAIGAGFLAKYSFLAAAAAALLGAMMHGPLRRALLSPKIVAALLAGGFVAAPHLLWMAAQDPGNAALLQDRLANGDGGATDVIEALGSLIWAGVSFLAPAAMVAAIALRREAASLVAGGRSALSSAAIVSAVGLAVAILFFGLSNFQERYAIAFFYPAYLALFATLARAAASDRALKALAGASLALVACFAGVRVAEIVRPGAPFCEDCRQHIPYTYLNEVLEKMSAQEATLVGFDDHTAGNLRRIFPRARVMSSHQPFYTPPARANRDCYFIWSTDLSPPPAQPVIDRLDAGGAARAGGVWRRVMSGETEARTTTWTIAAVDPATAFGAALCRI